MNRLTRILVLGLAVVLGSVMTIACGDDEDDNGASTTPPARTAVEGQGGGVSGDTVEARLAEYSIRLDKTSAAAGEITFEIDNAGTMPHEFVVLKTDLPEGQLPLDPDTSTVDEDVSGIDEIDEQEEFPAGESKTLEVDLEPGNYVFICNIAGHYQLGMHTSFSVR
jgi:uncharacterized cupredoxin-like copper-binding protein